MYQVISIGSALVDIYIHSTNFKSQPSQDGQLLCQAYGDKMEVESFSVHTGGGGSNTAVGFSRMGFKTAVVSETGRDKFSYLVTQDLKQAEVETRLLIEEKKEQTGGSVILVGDDGGRTVMVHRGASSMLDPYDIPAYWLSQSGWVHLSSIAGRKKTLKKIFKIVGREEQVGLSWNPGKKELMLLESRALSVEEISCQILFLNKQEWQMIGSIQNQILNKIKTVVITDSVRGGDVYRQGEHKLHYPALSTESVDNTGAGDSFAVGFVAGQLRNKTLEESAQMGALNAASVVKFYGAKAGLLTLGQIKTGLVQLKGRS